MGVERGHTIRHFLSLARVSCVDSGELLQHWQHSLDLGHFSVSIVQLYVPIEVVGGGVELKWRVLVTTIRPLFSSGVYS